MLKKLTLGLLLTALTVSGCGAQGLTSYARLQQMSQQEAEAAKKRDKTNPFTGLAATQLQPEAKCPCLSYEASNKSFKVTIETKVDVIDLLTINGKDIIKANKLVLGSDKDLEDASDWGLEADEDEATKKGASKDEARKVAILKGLSKLHAGLLKAEVKKDEKAGLTDVTALLKKFLKDNAPSKGTKTPGVIGI